MINYDNVVEAVLVVSVRRDRRGWLVGWCAVTSLTVILILRPRPPSWASRTECETVRPPGPGMV